MQHKEAILLFYSLPMRMGAHGMRVRAVMQLYVATLQFLSTLMKMDAIGILRHARGQQTEAP